MSDDNEHNLEEQEMEAQALEAIFDSNFVMETPNTWTVAIYPENEDEVSHVACKLHVRLPIDYPEVSLPNCSIEIIKGLAEEHQEELEKLVIQEAEANQGSPSIFAIAERVKEWLVENNHKGLDDISMHAIMMRKQKQKEKQALQQIQANALYESHQEDNEMTQAELEELAVRKRRAEGTPCTKENFEIWQVKFDAEMEELKKQQRQQTEEQDGNAVKGKKAATSAAANKENLDKAGRLTGFEQFSGKAANNYEALEAAAEQAENDETGAFVDEDEEEENNKNIDVDLFEEDVDLDDLSFDDEEEEDEDSAT